jgi:ATP-binding cassette, subfamily B, bacterial PglK
MLTSVRRSFALLDAGSRRWLVAYVISALLVSALEAAGLGMVYVFFQIALAPESIGDIAMLRTVHEQLGAPEPGRFLSILSAAVIAAFVLRAALMLSGAWIALAMRRALELTLVGKLFRIYLNKPLVWHAARGPSHLMNNVASNVGQVIQHIIVGALDLLSAAIMTAFLLATMAWLRPFETLVLCIVLALAGSAYLVVAQKRVVAWGEVMVQASEEKWRAVREPLRGIKTVKNLGEEEYFARRLDSSMARYLDVYVSQNMAQNVPRHVLEVLLIGGVLGAIGSAFAGGASASQVIPAMVLFGTAAIRLLPQATRAIQVLQYIQFSGSALAALGDDLGALARPRATFAPRGPARGFSAVSLRDVSFRYASAGQDALRSVSLTVSRGEHVALVGLSGAGKTTLADVLLGLVEPSSGVIMVDDARVSNMPRELFAYVPQEPFIVRDTLRRNIALGLDDGEIDDSSVHRAVQGAALAAFVARQPRGLDTVMTEDGTNLSGGEKQRLGIARALYRNCGCLVLDEPTSSLDALTEAEISATIAALRGTKTVVLVAHRLSTIRKFDRIVFMEDGQISAVGSFDDLYKRGGRFKTMVDFLSVSRDAEAALRVKIN